MTRWARSGSTQKHRKMPGDATPWEEFAQAAKIKSKNNTSVRGIKIKAGRIEKKKQKNKSFSTRKFKNSTNSNNSGINISKHDLNRQKNSVWNKTEQVKIDDDLPCSINDPLECSADISSIENSRRKGSFQSNTEVSIKEENDALSICFAQDDNVNNTIESRKLSKEQLKGAKRQNKLRDDARKETESDLYFKVDNACVDQNSRNKIIGASNNLLLMEKDETSGKAEMKNLSKSQIKRAKRRIAKRRIAKSGDFKNSKLQLNDYPEENDSESGSKTEKMLDVDKSLSDADTSAGKNLPVKELQESRITPLSLKVDHKMCELRKELQEKGLPEELIKDIIRKQRRTEKHKLRKYFCSKPCFNCRQIGHLLADCPFTKGKPNQGTNICFKCGSTEHRSSKCTKNVEGYPLAKCFICKTQGHISRDCPKNNHGIYPDGGKCSLCGNINHLRKDCPSLTKKREHIFSAHTINEGRSIDDEIIGECQNHQVNTKIKKKSPKQPKIVKF